MRNKLKEVRLKKNVPVEEIALKLNISPSFYYKIEAGTRNPSIELARKIALYFEKEMEELFFNQSMDEMSRKTHTA